MRSAIVLLAAVALALAPVPGFAHGPKITAAFGSDVHSAKSLGGMGVQFQQQDDDEPDVTQMVLLTLAISAGAAVLALIGYIIRQRVGFWPHRPPPRDSSEPEEHH